MPNQRLKLPDAEVIVDDKGSIIGICAGGKDTYFTRVIGGGGAAVSHTGSTAKVALARCRVPGGCVGPNGAFRLTALFGCTNNANSKTIYGELGGFDILSAQVINNASHFGAYHNKIMMLRGSLNAQAGVNGSDSAGVLLSSQPRTGSVDFAQEQELVISGQLANAADTISLQFWMLEAIPNIGG